MKLNEGQIITFKSDEGLPGLIKGRIVDAGDHEVAIQILSMLTPDGNTIVGSLLGNNLRQAGEIIKFPRDRLIEVKQIDGEEPPPL